jgi:hypothetical protein
MLGGISLASVVHFNSPAMTKIDLSELQKQPFIHRLNKDGSVDSICTHCFITVGSVTRAATEPELERAEAQHHCSVR